MQYVNYLGSLITDDAKCTREIKSRIVMAKPNFSKTKNLFTSKLGFNLGTSCKELYLEYSFVRC